jgi:hypothetical protein
MTSRLGIALLFSAAFAVACGDEADTAQLSMPVPGEQGPGTSIPRDEDESSAPAAPPATAASGESAPPAETTREPPSATTPPAPTKKVLDVKWYGQETYYWCGPGSTRMALGTRLANPPSQTTLANFMGTTTNGTDHIGLVANALNEYLPGAGYKSRPIFEPPTQAQRDLLKQDLIARIDKGFPIVANVISGWRPPGYPSGTIYHYIAVVGYDDGGAKVLIADPAAEGKGGGASWNNVPRTYWISLFDLGTWIGGKGYTG